MASVPTCHSSHLLYGDLWEMENLWQGQGGCRARKEHPRREWCYLSVAIGGSIAWQEDMDGQLRPQHAEFGLCLSVIREPMEIVDMDECGLIWAF